MKTGWNTVDQVDMRAAKKAIFDKNLLQEFVPLNALSPVRFRKLSEKIIIEEVLAGRYLFRKGDKDNQTIFLLEGKISLIDSFSKVTSEIDAGTDTSRHAISNQHPRPLSARAARKCIIARVDSALLDVFLTWDQSSNAEVLEIGADHNQDWMTRILQTEAFIKIPPAMIQSLLIKMESYPVKAGDIVIQQGDSGDYFYTIHEGRCLVTRKESPDAEAQFLAELSSGASFGEDALVSDAKRNATVTMLTDGLLMRLAKESFIELLKNQLVKRVNYEQALAMVAENAVWVDVRTVDEYENGAFEDSVNMPLSNLRDEMSELVFNTKYIICCDTGRRSESAGFMLSHKGFDVYVLEGGIPAPSTEAAPEDAPVIDMPEEAEAVAGVSAANNEKLAILQAENRKLDAEIKEHQSAETSMSGQMEQLRGELGESEEKLESLYSQVKSDTKEMRSLQERYADAVDTHRLELEQLEQQLSESRAQIETGREEYRVLEQEAASGQEAQQTIQQLQDALAQANERVLVLESDVVKSDEAGTVLLDEAENRLREQQALVERLREELNTAGQELADYQEQVRASDTESEASDRELREQLQQQTELSGKLQGDLDSLQQELVSASEDREHSAGTLQSLQQDNERLQAELYETVQLLDAQKEDAGKQLIIRQESEDALQQQQAGWEAERAALQQTTEDKLQEIEGLREEQEQIRKQAEESRDGLEKKQQEQLEQLESRNAELMAERSAHVGELDQAVTEQQQLQQALDTTGEEKAHLESELAALREESAGLADSSAKELQLLQEQLAAEQARAAGLEQSEGDKDAQIRDLQQEMLQSGEARSALEQELESLRQQHEGGHLHLEQQVEIAREHEKEYNEAIQKAHDDLMRKNDNEKELQGQINRLRKKLEQTTVDHKDARDSSQEDLDNLREELHAERQARAEERAEMAARQRELKEQLTAIAVEHEARLTNQSGAIEEARDAGREEEQERLRNLIEAQGQSEEQVLALQQELQKAHTEIADLTRKEKDRRQVDLDMMQEQNQQAESTITQLELQLKQLTMDRDTALEEQQTLRDKMNALRGEVEVARGLMNAGSQGQVEDPEKLRHELNESKKNMAIALRLRAEAEAARDQLIEDRNALREKLDGEAAASTPLQAPSLDADKAETDRRETLSTSIDIVAEEVRDKPVGLIKDSGQPTPVSIDEGSGERRWPGALIGFGVFGAMVLAVWLLIGGGDPLSHFFSIDDVLIEEYAGTDESELATMPPVATVSQPVKDVRQSDEVRAPVTIVTPAPVATTPPVAEIPPEKIEPAPVSDPAPVAAIRSFRDSLKSGSKGPEMIELPAAEYLMGSPGNSLNFDEGPRHKVSLPGFSISRNEVSFDEYDKFARSTGRRLPHDESWGRGKQPVINVSWNDARAYAAWLSKKTGRKYRLPTEAEWEYAARAGNMEMIWWDSNVVVIPANCFNCGSQWDGQRSAPTGSFRANDFGLHDMAGNVQEWTEDCYRRSYTGVPDDGGAWMEPGCTRRVVRGGGYTSPLDTLRNARRGQQDQDARLDHLGFRVVRSH